MVAVLLDTAADVVRHFAHTEDEAAVADFDKDIFHQEIRRFHTDGVAGGLGELDFVDPGHLQAGEAAEFVFLGLVLDGFRRLGGGEGKDGEQRRREKGEESFHRY